MAVLVEAISIVIRCDAVVKAYEGGIKAFTATLPNQSLCSDGELACLRFMTPQAAQKYAEQLEARGLRHKAENKAADFVVVDQLSGLCSPCEWAVFGKTDWNNNPEWSISVCKAVLAMNDTVYVPDGWIYKSSLSENCNYVESDSISEM
jgi:hypothetical protein